MPLSYLLISFRLNYIVLAALTLYFYCRGSYKVCCKTALSFLGKFSMCLLCKECDLYHCEKKKFSFIFWICPQINSQHLVWILWHEKESNSQDFLCLSQQGSHTNLFFLVFLGFFVFFFLHFVLKINSGMFLLCHILFYL